jgi:hypothetical protein
MADELYMIEALKALAHDANKEGDWDLLKRIIDRLEQVWTDDHAAFAFYTELEQAVTQHAE